MLFYFLTLKIGQNVYFSYNSAIQLVKILNHMSLFAWYLLARAPQAYGKMKLGHYSSEWLGLNIF